MKLRWLGILAIIAGVGAWWWLDRPHHADTILTAATIAEAAKRSSQSSVSGSSPPASAKLLPTAHVRRVEPSPDGRIILPEIAEMARTLHQPDSPPAADLETLQDLVGNYRNIMGSLPFGLNHEIAEQLSGQNAKRYAVLPPDFAAFNPNGELVDRWGTPYFFHALNEERLEIRSAGADKLLWSKDDIGEITSP